MIDIGKICSICKVFKPFTEYHKHRTQQNGHVPACKPCNIKRNFIKGQLLKRYGLTIEDYNRILEEQNSRCGICGRTDSGRKTSKRLCVDHDHETKRVRGLLCNNCNLGIGRFKTQALLEKAIIYYKKHGAK